MTLTEVLQIVTPALVALGLILPAFRKDGARLDTVVEGVARLEQSMSAMARDIADRGKAHHELRTSVTVSEAEITRELREMHGRLCVLEADARRPPRPVQRT